MIDLEIATARPTIANKPIVSPIDPAISSLFHQPNPALDLGIDRWIIVNIDNIVPI